MKPTTQTAGLIVILFILTLAMGLTFGESSGGGGASNVSNSSNPPTPTPSYAPRVVVVAQGADSSYLYQSFLSNASGQPLRPLVGVRVTLTLLYSVFVPPRERAPPITMRTNSSGIASVLVEPGNYSVAMAVSGFRANTSLSLAVNSTTTINLALRPSGYAVTAFHLVSPDSTTGVEPTTEVDVLLENQSAPAMGFAELIGYPAPILANGTIRLVIGNELKFNATVIGSYSGVRGTWAVLSPVGYSPACPATGVVLFQFKPDVEVVTVVG